jgi:DNA uptake protein ComE-like DNA-binding protein
VANTKNLRPGEYKFSHEEQVAGGIASGKARHEIATMKKTLEAMLKQKNDKGITYQELSTLGLIKGAVNGKAENYKVMLQLLGELEEQEQTGTPQVNINIVDNSELEKVLYEDENE